ncbi:MAG: metallophosphoesterase family protein [Chloroflexi bacterium]|nr:metallophosphoesterase family protein [Chloroflexota bacterium]
MRLAVLSDIHGNLAALETVLADLEQAGGADITWCLGDLAAFGPRPAECIRRIKALAEANESKTFKVIGGNTDRYLVTGERLATPAAKDEAAFKTLASGWQARDAGLNWAVEQISFEDYEYLKKLIGRELAHTFEGCHVIGYHAVPGNDETFLLPDTPDEEARDLLLDREGHVAIGGHTHRQMDRHLGSWRAVNVGSVGMSFDNPGYAQWGLLTFENGQVSVDLRRVPYDVNAVITDLRAVGYPAPEWTASRLRPT